VGWNNHMRKARDSTRPLGSRYKHLGSCVQGLSWMNHGSYNAIWRRLLAKHPTLALTSAPGSFSSDELLACALDLENERNAFLAQLEAFRARRLAEKRLGRRQPRKTDLASLFAVGEAERAHEMHRRCP
jgi:hypothetical protein